MKQLLHEPLHKMGGVPAPPTYTQTCIYKQTHSK